MMKKPVNASLDRKTSYWIITAELNNRPAIHFALSNDKAKIGRAASNDVCLPDDAAVSAFHAQLTCQKDNSWLLEDLQSKNGVFVEISGGKSRIAEPYPLKPNQNFYIGHAKLSIESITRKDVSNRYISSRKQPSSSKTLVVQFGYHQDTLAVQTAGLGAKKNRHTLTVAYEDLVESARLLHRDVVAKYLSGVEQSEPGTELEHLGEMFYRRFLPRRIREKIANAKEEALLLVLEPDLLSIPWELSYDGRNFLCLSKDISRQVVVDDVSSHQNVHSNMGRRRVLIIVDPTEDLPDVRQGAEQLFELMRNECSDWLVTFLWGRRVTRLDLLMRLEQADIVYYCGHACYDSENPENSGWRLRNGQLTGSDFQNLAHTPSLVFANACDTAKEVPAKSWSHECSMSAGFILAGAQHYIGCGWPITPNGAASFAQAFFKYALTGDSLANAVRKARLDVIALHGLGELAWAGYVLYGNPDAKLL